MKFNPLTLSPELAAHVRRDVGSLRPAAGGAEWAPSEWPLRVSKEEMGAVPLHSNEVYLWALRPDGTLLCLDHEAFARPVAPETDPRAAVAALLEGTKRYPELAALVPALRVPLLAWYGRVFRASELSRVEWEEAVHERRVLLVADGARAFGEGDVWFTVATPENQIDAGRRDGGVVYRRRPIEDPRDSWGENVYDRAGEFFRDHDRDEIEQPCRRMDAGQRLRYKRAAARFLADLLALLPPTLGASYSAYRVLLRRYADAPNEESAGLYEQVVACARATGGGRLVFDPEGRWEADGDVAPVAGFLCEELPRALGEWVLSDVVDEKGARAAHWLPARDWLHEHCRRWATDAAWAVAHGEPLAVVAFPPPEAPPPAPLGGPPPAPAPALPAGLDALHARWLRGFCFRELTRAMRGLASVPATAGDDLVTERIEAAEAWCASATPGNTRRALEAGRRADAAGRHAFAAPFRLLALRDPAAIVETAAAAARQLAAAALRAWTTALLPPVPEEIEAEARAAAEHALRESARRFLARLLADAVPFSRHKDLLADGTEGWRLEPAPGWRFGGGVLHGSAGAGVTALVAAIEHAVDAFELEADVKVIGGVGAVPVRGCDIGIGEGRWGGLWKAGRPDEPLCPALPPEDAVLLAHEGDWNRLWITAEGARLTVHLNAVQVAEIHSAAAEAAPLAFFLAASAGGSPTVLELRRLHLRGLTPRDK